jgi:hypothetical protein
MLVSRRGRATPPPAAEDPATVIETFRDLNARGSRQPLE